LVGLGDIGNVNVDDDQNGGNVVDTVDGVGGGDSAVFECGGDDVDGDAVLVIGVGVLIVML
jgi:hypothetical protein